MHVATLTLDVLLGDVRSLKQKRALVRPLIAELRRLDVAVAETGNLDLHRRAGLGVGLVAADHAHLVDVLDAVEQLVAYRPEVELLSAHRIIRHSDD